MTDKQINNDFEYTLESCDKISFFVKHDGTLRHKIYAEVIPTGRPIFIVSAETVSNLINNINYQIEQMHA